MKLRTPAWCDTGASLSVNGDAAGVDLTPGSYATISRSWQPGDIVELRLPMPVRVVQSHPDLFENSGRVAVFRGPVLYCAEQADNPGIDPRDATLTDLSSFDTRHDPGFLGGVTTLTTGATVTVPAPEWSNRLYRPVSAPTTQSPIKAARLTLIPYFTWANREPGPMEVWLRATGL